MAITKLTDIIEPSVYLDYMQNEFPEKNAFMATGILMPAPAEVQAQMNAGGSIIDMPKWDDLARAEPDIWSDNEATLATPGKVTTLQEKAVKNYWHRSWSNMSLAGIIATGQTKDPERVAIERMGAWWTKNDQAVILSMAAGVIADNVANDSGDMVYDIYSDIASPAAANKISKAAVTQARLTMGDHLSELGVIAVHSAVYGTMLDNDDIDFIPDSNQPGEIPTFNGLRVVYDDDMPVATGVNSDEYTSYLFGAGAFVRADGSIDADEAFERDRTPAAGNGGGQTVIHTRRHTLLHCKGISFISGSVAGKSPTRAEMALAANHNRILDRKQIPLVALKTNI